MHSTRPHAHGLPRLALYPGSEGRVKTLKSLAVSCVGGDDPLHLSFTNWGTLSLPVVVAWCTKH